jgi:phage-related protein
MPAPFSQLPQRESKIKASQLVMVQKADITLEKRQIEQNIDQKSSKNTLKIDSTKKDITNNNSAEHNCRVHEETETKALAE